MIQASRIFPGFAAPDMLDGHGAGHHRPVQIYDIEGGGAPQRRAHQFTMQVALGLHPAPASGHQADAQNGGRRHWLPVFSQGADANRKRCRGANRQPPLRPMMISREPA
jgi:hypothetical protein